MTLPNFLVIGTAKSGTSTLLHLLRQHPDVGLASAWEPDFFAHDRSFAQGLGFYRRYFAACHGKTAIGEKSWRYSVQDCYPRARERIARHLPQARLIYIAREPLARVTSLWMERRSSGVPTSPDFNRSIREDPVYVESSLYWKQIDAYRQHFADERILVLFFEDLVADQAATLRAVQGFLGLKERPPNEAVLANPSKGKKHDTTIARALRGVPILDRLRDRAPRAVRAWGRRLLKQDIEPPGWEAATREWFLREIEQDNRMFLARYGKPPGFWRVRPGGTAVERASDGTFVTAGGAPCA